MERQGSQQTASASSAHHDDINHLILQKDANIFGKLLPTDVWELICERLPLSGMRDMSNASLYFRSILLPKRTTFLFPDVIKHLVKYFEEEELKGPLIFVKREDHKIEEVGGSDKDYHEQNREDVNSELENDYEMVKNVPNILKCRQVCKSWTNSIDQFIEDTSQPSFFNTEIPSPNKLALAQAKYRYFGYHSWKLDEYMADFEKTHSPLLLRPPRNPFIGRLVVLQIPSFPFRPPHIRDQMMDQGKAMLRHYGQHIRILNIGVVFMVNNDVPHHLWLTECISLVPNLTHLKVGSFPTFDDMQFGEHIHHPNFGRESSVDEDELEELVRDLDGLMEEVDIDDAPNNLVNPVVEEVPLVDIEASPLPFLKCLKLCHMPVVTYNHLIQNYRHVEWLHIEFGHLPEIFYEGRNYLDWRQVEFPNLKIFYLQLRSPAEARQLWYLNASLWGNLTSVHLEYSWKADFFEWSKVFETIEAHWGQTLVELKLRLPKPSNFMEGALAYRDAVNCKLTLPKLKRIKIWISKSCDDFPLTFLESVMQLPGLEFKRYDDYEDH